MSGATAFEVSGFAELDRKLSLMEKGVSLERVVSVIEPGAQLIADDERRLVPRRTGRGADSITVTSTPGNLPNDGTVYIGPTEDAWYLVFAEFGTVRQPVQSFVRPAVEAQGSNALQLVITGLRHEVFKLTA